MSYPDLLAADQLVIYAVSELRAQHSRKPGDRKYTGHGLAAHLSLRDQILLSLRPYAAHTPGIQLPSDS